MYCASCGSAISGGSRFCGSCGATAPTAPIAPSRPPRSSKPLLIGGTIAAVVVASVAGLLVGHVRLAAAPVRQGTPLPTAAPALTSAPALSATAASPTTEDLAGVYRESADGVVRIETAACDGGDVGSGFLLAPDLVATVAHVVANADTVAVRDDDQDASGVVVGIDQSRDLALVRLSHALSGHVFQLASADPDVGSTVAAIGYPLAGPRSLSRGTISGLDRTSVTEAGPLGGLIQTDTAINPGNSGGPLLNLSGKVVGLVDAKSTQAEGIGFAIPAESAAGVLRAWQDDPHPQYGSACSDPNGSDQIHADVSIDTDHPDARGIADTLTTYATGINTGDYDTAYDDLGPDTQAQTSRQEFAGTHTSSYLFDLHLEAVTTVNDGDRAVVRFTSVQSAGQGHNGQTCSLWRITYRMVAETGSDGHWLIDEATADPGYPRPCGTA